MRLPLRTLAFLLVITFPIACAAQQKPTADISFTTAKKRAAEIYADRPITFYCGCMYKPNTTGPGGKVDATTCGYQVRQNLARGERIEWEHIIPASRFGSQRTCWQTGHLLCTSPPKGRKCCRKQGVDDEFRRMEADLHNLVPAVGELNADRSNFQFGDIAGEERKYGACNLEVSTAAKTAEAPEERRGEIARAYLYMNAVWGMAITPAEKTRFEAWHANDPPSGWEIVRDFRIEAAQGNSTRISQINYQIDDLLG